MDNERVALCHSLMVCATVAHSRAPQSLWQPAALALAFVERTITDSVSPIGVSFYLVLYLCGVSVQTHFRLVLDVNKLLVQYDNNRIRTIFLMRKACRWILRVMFLNHAKTCMTSPHLLINSIFFL